MNPKVRNRQQHLVQIHIGRHGKLNRFWTFHHVTGPKLVTPQMPREDSDDDTGSETAGPFKLTISKIPRRARQP